jgi:hypothetical protein
MKRRKTLGIAIAAFAVAGALVLPGTAAAGSYTFPAYNPNAIVIVPTSGDLSYDAVSWDAVSWSD